MPAAVLGKHHVTFAGRADGPVLLFAHGFGCDQNVWQRLVPAFADDYRLVLFDHVGAGRSDLCRLRPRGLRLARALRRRRPVQQAPAG